MAVHRNSKILDLIAQRQKHKEENKTTQSQTSNKFWCIRFGCLDCEMVYISSSKSHCPYFLTQLLNCWLWKLQMDRFRTVMAGHYKTWREHSGISLMVFSSCKHVCTHYLLLIFIVTVNQFSDAGDAKFQQERRQICYFNWCSKIWVNPNYI